MLKTKPVTQIYVSHIIEEVGICKGTFYKYYRDKYDLLQKCFYHEYYAEILEHAETFEQFAVGCLNAFRKVPKIARHAMTEDRDSVFGYHSRLSYEYLLKDRERQGKETEGEFCVYLLKFYADSATQIMVDRLGSPHMGQTEEIMRLIRGAMPQALL